MATYRKKGNAWKAEVARLGVRESATFDTKAQAEQWAIKREAEILAQRGQLQRVKSDYTFKDAAERYKKEVAPTKKGERWEHIRIDLILRTCEFAGQRLHKITANDIGKWRNARSNGIAGYKALANSSVNRELNLLSAIFEVARLEWRWVGHNPVHDVKRPMNPPPRDRRVSENEIDLMCNALGYQRAPLSEPRNKSHYLALAFLFAIETGMRQSEMLLLTWDRVHLDRHCIRLLQTKNGAAREVPLSPMAAKILEVLPKGVNDYAFAISSASADALWRKARTKARIDDLHFHDSRHEAITRLAKKLQVLDLARMVGHKDLKSLMIYYNETATELALKLAA